MKIKFPLNLSGYILETSKGNLELLTSKLSSEKVFEIQDLKGERLLTCFDIRRN